MRINLFKLVSVITYSCLIFPLATFISAILQSDGLGMNALIAGIAVSIVCFILANIFNTSNAVVGAGTVLVTSVIATFVVRSFSQNQVINFFTVYQLILIFIFIFIVGLNGFKAYPKDIASFVSRKKIIGFLLSMLIVIGISMFYENQTLNAAVDYLTISFVIALIGCLYILNRTLLESLYKNKSSDATTVSKIVQRYNLIIVSGFAIVFLGLFAVRSIVSYYIQLFFAYLGIGLINIAQKSNDDGKLKVTPPPNVTEQPKVNFDEFVTPPNKDLINTVITVFAIIIASVVLIFLIRFLIRFAPEKIKILIAKLKEIFRRMMGFEKVIAIASDRDFIDEVEDIEKDDPNLAKKLKILQSQRKVRNIKDPVERMRAFYGYFMNTLKKNNVPLIVSDTSYQIYNKSQRVCTMEEITKEVTEIYNEVRYNDMIPDNKTLENIDNYMTDITKNCVALKVEEDDKKAKKERNKRR